MTDEKDKPKLVLKQPTRDTRIRPPGTEVIGRGLGFVVRPTKAAAKKAAVKKAPSRKATSKKTLIER